MLDNWRLLSERADISSLVPTHFELQPSRLNEKLKAHRNFLGKVPDLCHLVAELTLFVGISIFYLLARSLYPQ